MEEKSKLTWRRTWQLTLRAWRIWWKRCPGYFAAVVLRDAIQALGPYVAIYLSARLINELAGSRDPQALLWWVGWQLGTLAFLTLAGGLCTRWAAYYEGTFYPINRRVYMDKMLDMDYADLDRQAVYELYSKLMQSQTFIGFGVWGALMCFIPLLNAFFQTLGGIALSISLFLLPVPAGSPLAILNHWLAAPLTLLVLLILTLSASASNSYSQSFFARYAEKGRASNRYFSFFCHTCQERSRAMDMRLYRQQEQVCSPYMSRNMDLGFGPRSQFARWARGPMGLSAALSQGLNVVLTGLIYGFVCLKAWGGAFGVGSVTQYVGAITKLFLGLSDGLSTLSQIRTNAAFLEDSFRFLDIPNAMYQGSLTTEKRSDRQYEVEFRDVSFRYPGTDQWALRHVNLKFRVGSRLAVVGPNGSGKTTFIKLLCRLYDPTEGEILLNGIDIRKYRYDDYIGIFSVVFQDFKLFSLPVGENIGGRKDYDRQQAEACLHQAGLTERLSSMPKGLDTFLYKDLDQSGVDVSGGEAQKLAIARALYKDAPFIILDEPTAALDPIAEADIYSRFNDIAGDRTAIYISHRLSSCKFCDEIAVFDQGNIIQKGSHEALLRDVSGLYRQLWDAQAQYYVTEPQS